MNLPSAELKGWRKVFAGGAGALTILAAYVAIGLFRDEAGKLLAAQFPILSGAIGSIVLLVVGGNVAEHFAQKAAEPKA